MLAPLAPRLLQSRPPTAARSLPQVLGGRPSGLVDKSCGCTNVWLSSSPSGGALRFVYLHADVSKHCFTLSLVVYSPGVLTCKHRTFFSLLTNLLLMFGDLFKFCQ